MFLGIIFYVVIGYIEVWFEIVIVSVRNNIK